MPTFYEKYYRKRLERVRERTKAKEGSYIHKKLESTFSEATKKKLSNAAKEVFKKTYAISPSARIALESKMWDERMYREKEADAGVEVQPEPSNKTTYITTGSDWIEDTMDFGAGVKAKLRKIEERGDWVKSGAGMEWDSNATITKTKAFNTMSVGELKRTETGSYGTIPDPKTGRAILFRLSRREGTLYFRNTGKEGIYLRKISFTTALWKSEEEVIKALRSKNYITN